PYRFLLSLPKRYYSFKVFKHHGLKNSFIASFRLNTSTVNFPSTLRTTLPEKASLSVHIRQQNTLPLSDGLVYFPERLWNMNSGSSHLQWKHFFIQDQVLFCDTSYLVFVAGYIP